ncbi:MFS transporter [Mycolicibacterium chitae]|uniref:General substrate transporter:Major facilitator superfamily MFS_1 n=1 Tax=Mycolicibacterium chitae TaxID=1792 RepID=A0A448IDK9_MYCCI|nr:MFS transporter [Mycolicibacterium chitae]MCV7106126.1 MFS transporter [Mycolicibacterium chitae]BBZ01679.1 MFS transporter [Mycolicibacterium chitae]VEG50515.1 General substrate transporter:Major facilitator superfamily MFS_1 [Mycolicibacterium chitae]
MTLAPPIRVQSVIDDTPMNVKRWGVVALCFVIALLDGFDTQSIAFIGSSIAEEFAMSTAAMTAVITASTVGMALGAITLGSVGDRIGRKRAILLALTIFGFFSFLGAFAQAPWQIILLRFLIGLGMGGATPSLLALAAEYSPVQSRKMSMTLVLLGLPGGAMLGGVVAAAWLPVLGWRGIFLLGGVLPLILLLVVVLALPESPSYLATRGDAASQTKARNLLQRMTGAAIPAGTVLQADQDDDENAGSIRALFDSTYRNSTITICAIYLANWVAWFLLLQWTPTALHQAGLSKEQAASGTIVVNGAFILFSFLVAALLSRVAIRTLLLGMFGVGILVALGLSVSGSNWTLTFLLIALAGFGIGGQQLVLNYLIAETYPTQLRGTATGFSIGVGRTGSIIGSSLGGALLSSVGVGGYFGFIAVPLAIAALATLTLRSRQRNVSPEDHHDEDLELAGQDR